MTPLRDIKRRARRDLHRAMGVPALYLLGAAEPLPVSVRVHTKFQALGDEGGGAGWGERQDVTPKLIFDRLEIVPRQGALISVEAGEAYSVGAVSPADGEFVTVTVAAMSAAQIAKTWPAGQPLPEA